MPGAWRDRKSNVKFPETVEFEDHDRESKAQAFWLAEESVQSWVDHERGPAYNSLGRPIQPPTTIFTALVT